MANERFSAGGAMPKSLTFPSHMTTSLPDPFPELSRHKMRLYHFQNMERTGDEAAASGMSDAERRSPSNVPSNSVVTTETSSTADHLTEVVIVIVLIMMIKLIMYTFLVARWCSG